MISCSLGRSPGLRSWTLATAMVLLPATLLSGQETPATGNVEGVVTDQAGKPIGGARITVKSKATQTSVSARTNAQGAYSTEQIAPGNYAVVVEARDFQTVDFRVEVKAGAAAKGDAKLEPINPGGPKVESHAPGTLTETYPVNGRNFLDLAQLEPALQEVDGAALNGNKAGFFALSIAGRSGRTTRIQVDGIDSSDETVGTTTQNVTTGGIREVQVTRSLQDISAPLTSAGTARVLTQSGANALHGDGFYNFRDKRVGFASFPGGLDLPFQRNQFGGAVGGAIIKDKAFFFLSGEHTKQGGQSPVAMNFPFNSLSGGYSAPLHETTGLGRLDWNVKPGVPVFYRISYDTNKDVWSAYSFSPFQNQNTTQSHAGGVDFRTGIYAHSIRGGYSKFVNHLDASVLGGFLDPAPGLNLVLGQLQTGPNPVARQETIQRNIEGRYDGSRPWSKRGPHTFRYGASINRIEVGGFTAYGALAPSVSSAQSLNAVQAVLNNAAAPFAPLLSGDPAGRADNPLNYPVNEITIYNGQGFTSEKSAFGLTGGGRFDTRIDAYVGDTWKVLHNLSVTLGVHYTRDTGRTDSDLAPVTCAQINTSRFPIVPCQANNLVLDQFGFLPGLGKQVKQPNMNLGPQAGLAWDPGSNGKTVVRLGGGLYFENNLFNNIQLDRRARLAQGQFFGSANLCPNGTVLFANGTPVSSIDGLNIASQICGQPIGDVATAISDLQKAYQAATNAAGATNQYFIGNTLTTMGLLAPAYKSPRVIQMNFGFQRELGRGSMLSIDYVRAMGTHFLQGVDTNHVGDARYIDVNAGLTAINNTIAGNPITSGVCAPANSAGSSSQTAINCYLAHVPGANISDFASHGLDSANAYCGGYPCAGLGKNAAAFGGVNPLVGSNVMYFPGGRSRYSGLQVSLRTSSDRPARAVRRLDMAFSYTFSRYKDNVPVGNGGILGDVDVLAKAGDYNSPNNARFFGPAALDRTHQIRIGPVFTLPHGLELGLVAHFDSPLPLTLFLPQAGNGGVAGEIFRSDATGDGTVGDMVPGSRAGDFGRSISTAGLAKFINTYNRTSAGQLTPAGAQLVTSLLFTQGQLVTLGAVTPTLQAPPAGNVGLSWLKSTDLRLKWPVRVREGLTVEPSVAVFNVLNNANFDLPQRLLSGVLDSSPGIAVNNVTGNCGSIVGVCTARTNRAGLGSGVYSLGAPRQLELGLKITF